MVAQLLYFILKLTSDKGKVDLLLLLEILWCIILVTVVWGTIGWYSDASFPKKVFILKGHSSESCYNCKVSSLIYASLWVFISSVIDQQQFLTCLFLKLVWLVCQRNNGLEWNLLKEITHQNIDFHPFRFYD